MLAIAVILSAACLGALLASSRVPRVRFVPIAAVGVLIALLAAALIVLDAGSVGLSLAFVVVTGVVSTFYSAVLWIREVPESPYKFSWFFRNGLVRPGWVRQHAQAVIDHRAAEGALTREQ